MKIASVLCLALLFAELCTPASANAPSRQSQGFGALTIDKGLVVGAIVGIAAVAAVGVTFLVLHNRGVVVGCIAESGGKLTLVRSDKTVYSLLDTGPALPIGERAKLKGHKSGPSSAPAFQVDKVLKAYGRCQP
jgi:hypothetical protein